MLTLDYPGLLELARARALVKWHPSGIIEQLSVAGKKHIRVKGLSGKVRLILKGRIQKAQLTVLTRDDLVSGAEIEHSLTQERLRYCGTQRKDRPTPKVQS